MTSRYQYCGEELELFAHAKTWKRYFQSKILPYIKGDVLEVGAGIGNNVPFLGDLQYNSWFFLEPDHNLFTTLKDSLSVSGVANCRAQHGTVESLKADQRFDTILYIDVLEHIEQDHQEMNRIGRHLNPGGYLIILSPAHQWLFTAFDQSIGHYRRYDRNSLKKLLPADIDVRVLYYLDSFGLLASLGNKLFLKKSMPTLKQIKIWDTKMVPLSRRLDPLLGYNLGKSLLLIGRKQT